MADENLRSKHAFGNSENLDAASSAGKVDTYDILLLDGDTDKPKIGWIDKNGNKVIVPSCEGMDETIVDEKIEGAVTIANNYTDEQITALLSSFTIVEF